jgi:hypothetical protein
MPDTTAKIRAKGCENTGVTEDLAAELHTAVGRHIMAIVELHVVQKHGPDTEGKRGVELVLTQVEPATDDTVDDHLRELTRTLHQNRKLKADDEQLQIQTGDDIAPRPADVIAAGQKHITHEFTLGPDGLCDVCGLDQADRLHIITDALTDDPDAEEPASNEGGNHEAVPIEEPTPTPGQVPSQTVPDPAPGEDLPRDEAVTAGAPVDIGIGSPFDWPRS